MAGSPLPQGLLGTTAWDRAAPQTRLLDIGNLPWPPIMDAVFSVAAARFLRTDEYTPVFTRTMLELILERSHTYHAQDFVDHMAGFGTRPPAQRVLFMQGLTTAALTTLNRPGAWLLDYAYTLVCVLYGDIQPSARYSPVPNSCHLAILGRCFPDAVQVEHGSSLNNRGNQMEALAWLAFEADRPELVLAMAYHSRINTERGIGSSGGLGGRRRCGPHYIATTGTTAVRGRARPILPPDTGPACLPNGHLAG